MNKFQKPNGRRPAPAKSQKPQGRGLKGQGQSANRAFIAVAKKGSTSMAMMRSTAKGSHVAHKELIGTVNGSTAFTATKYVCNPGIAATFRWLSVQAQQWEQYRFNKLRFRYLTRCATTTVGSVIMAPDYDPSDSAPASELAVSTYQDCVEDAVWVEQLVCDLDVASMFPNGAKKFVRTGAVGSEDLKLYDAANFFLCTVEEVGADAIGKLWVEYDVDFFTPQVAPSGDPTSRYTSRFADDASQALANSVAEPLLFSDLSEDPLGIGAPVVGVFTPPRGSYRIDAYCSIQNTSAEATTATLAIYKNGVSISNQSSGYFSLSLTANAKVQISCMGIVNCDGADTFQVQITVVGAAGTLTVPASTQSLLVTPA